jgi:hypothetical protein
VPLAAAEQVPIELTVLELVQRIALRLSARHSESLL